MFNSSADIESAPHWTRCAPRSRRQRKVEDQSAVGFRAPTNEITHRVAPKSTKTRGLLAHSLLGACSLRELNAARITCGSLERRLVVASRYPGFQCGGLDHPQLLSDRHLHL